MPRAIWKGAISFGLVHIPVELYPAESRQGLDLDILDRRDFAPVGYKLYNKQTGKDIERKDTVKGYQFERDKYVVLSEEDLKRANVEATQTIDIQSFVDAGEVSPLYFEQPYYLAPSRGGDKVYVLLRETLQQADKIGIAQVVIRTKQHLAALMPVGEAIVLNILRYQEEIRSLEGINLPDAKSKRAAVSDKEIKMALSLLEDMTEPWQPERYHDTYREDVMAMIDKKIAAHQVNVISEAETEAAPAPQARSNVVDLMDLLKKSIEGKGRTKPAARNSVQDEEEDKSPRKSAGKASRTSRTTRKAPAPKSDRDKHTGSSSRRSPRAAAG
jgi:DNA end-binding protein Ku